MLAAISSLFVGCYDEDDEVSRVRFISGPVWAHDLPPEEAMKHQRRVNSCRPWWQPDGFLSRVPIEAGRFPAAAALLQ